MIAPRCLLASACLALLLPTGFADDHHRDPVPIDMETVDCVKDTLSASCYVEAPPVPNVFSVEFEMYYLPWLPEESELSVPLLWGPADVERVLDRGTPGGTGTSPDSPPPVTDCYATLHTHGVSASSTQHYSMAQVHVHHDEGADCHSSQQYHFTTSGRNGRVYDGGHDNWWVYFYDFRDHPTCIRVILMDGSLTNWKCWNSYN